MSINKDIPYSPNSIAECECRNSYLPSCNIASWIFEKTEASIVESRDHYNYFDIYIEFIRMACKQHYYCKYVELGIYRMRRVSTSY
jgi:hypothetical protein